MQGLRYLVVTENASRTESIKSSLSSLRVYSVAHAQYTRSGRRRISYCSLTCLWSFNQFGFIHDSNSIPKVPHCSFHGLIGQRLCWQWPWNTQILCQTHISNPSLSICQFLAIFYAFKLFSLLTCALCYRYTNFSLISVNENPHYHRYQCVRKLFWLFKVNGKNIALSINVNREVCSQPEKTTNFDLLWFEKQLKWASVFDKVISIFSFLFCHLVAIRFHAVWLRSVYFVA